MRILIVGLVVLLSGCVSPFHRAEFETADVEPKDGFDPEILKRIIENEWTVKIEHDRRNHFVIEMTNAGERKEVWDELSDKIYVKNVRCERDSENRSIDVLRANLTLRGIAGGADRRFHAIWTSPHLGGDFNFGGDLHSVRAAMLDICDVLFEGELEGQLHQGQWHSKP